MAPFSWDRVPRTAYGTNKFKAQYTPPTPTRLNCRVESRRRSVIWNSQPVGDSIDESKQICQQRVELRRVGAVNAPVGSRRELVENCVHTADADATQLSTVASRRRCVLAIRFSAPEFFPPETGAGYPARFTDVAGFQRLDRVPAAELMRSLGLGLLFLLRFDHDRLHLFRLPSLPAVRLEEQLRHGSQQSVWRNLVMVW